VTRAWALAVLLAGCAAPSEVDRLLRQNEASLRSERPLAAGLLLRCAPNEAEVMLDGVLQGTCEDFAQRLLEMSDEGHRVEVRRAGFLTYEAQVAPGHARTRLEVTLARAR
jgi:hypothetical protein